MKDFFREYHKHDKFHWIASTTLALFLSVGTVGLLITGSTGLQADLSKSKGVSYEADIILQTSDGRGEIVFGSDASEVDMVRLTVLGDPERFTGLASVSPDVHISSGVPGIYSVQIDTKKISIHPGQVLAVLTFSGSDQTRLTMTDTDFVSGSGVYNLTNQVK